MLKRRLCKLLIIIFYFFCILVFSNKTKNALAHTHTEECYAICTGTDYNKDGVIDLNDCKIIQEGNDQHYYCRICGKEIFSVIYAGTQDHPPYIKSYSHGRDHSKLICNNSDIISIAATNPAQIVAKGGSIDTTAVVKYVDGTTKIVSCTSSGYNPDSISTQTVALSYIEFGMTISTNITVCVTTPVHVHTNSCYQLCQGIDYNNDGIINEYDCICYTNNSGRIPYITCYCRKCGALVYEGYTSLENLLAHNIGTRNNHYLDNSRPICLSMTTPPSVGFSNINSNTILTERNNSFPLQIRLSDHGGETLICAYYLDGNPNPEGTMVIGGTASEKTASFSKLINAANLKEGEHTIKITAQNCLCSKKGEASVSFKVDIYAPIIQDPHLTVQEKAVNIKAIAADVDTNLSYQYILMKNGVVISTTGFISDTFSFNNLTPNTAYSCKIRVKDSLDHVNEKVINFATPASTPCISMDKSSLKTVLISDNNANDNTYKVIVTNTGNNVVSYADAKGDLITAPTWITLFNSTTNKKQIKLNLEPGNSYRVQVIARNNVGGTDTISNSIGITTAPTFPANIKAVAGYDQKNGYFVKLTWDRAANATSYEIYKEPLTAGETSNTSSTSNAEYIDNKVSSNQTYQYKIRSVNGQGAGDYSSVVQVKTLPQLPAQVSGIAADIKGSVLNLTWNAVTGATGYSIKVTANGAAFNRNTVENKVTIDTKSYNSQCDVVIYASNATGQGKEGKATFYTLVNTPVLKSINEDKITCNSISLQWEANGNPESVAYNISIISTKSQNNIEVTTYSIDNGIVTYHLSGLDQDTAYTFKVMAKNSKAQSEWSAEKSAITKAMKPDDPSGLYATNTKGIIYLHWNMADYAQSYTVERTCGNEIVNKSVAENSYKDTDTIAEKTYWYRVKAVNKAGESNWSTPFSVTPEQTQVPTVIEASGSSMSITVSWKPVDGASGYDIEVDGKDSINLGTDTSYEHIGLTPGSSHSYRVRSRNSHGESEWSELVISQTIPDAPGNISVNASKEEIRIAWDAVNGAASYEIEIDGKVCGNTVDSAYSYTISDKKTEHMISVRAVNQSGASSWSIPVMATATDNELPVIAKPAIPEMVVVASGSAISIKWNKCKGATSYQLEADGETIYTGAITSFTQTGLVENSKHVYRIQASNFGISSGWSAAVTVVIDKLSITKPQNITYYRENDTTTVIAWDKMPDIEKYRIEIKKGDTVILDTELSMNKAQVSITPGETYAIRIAAVKTENATNTYEWSDKLLMVAPSLLPAVPKMNDLKAASDSATITWNKVEGASGYEIEADGKVVNVKNNITYTNNGLKPSTSHSYRIRSYNTAGKSAWSDKKTIATNEGVSGVPFNISWEPVAAANESTGSAIQMKWDKVDGATSYEVVDKNNITYKTNQNSITINNLIPGADYYFKVRAVKNNVTGGFSSLIYVVPDIIAPQNVTMKAVNGKVQISWDKIGGASTYELEINGVLYKKTVNTNYIEFEYADFYMKRTIRVRGIKDTLKGNWSTETVFEQALPIEVTGNTGEEFSVILPVKNVTGLDQYKLTLTYNLEDVELVDACELTTQKERETTYIKEYDTNIIIDKSGSTGSITIIANNNKKNNWTGIAGGIRLRSKVDGKLTLHYGVTVK